jgi:DNA repair exonuclease SbcCD ATPase subunit
MSIFNPWAEVRKLKAQLEAGYETYRVEETQQQAEWAKKSILLEELKRDNAALRRELSNLSAPAKKISRLESNLKRRAGVVERRNNEIKSLKRMLRELREKYNTTFAVRGEAANNMGLLKILCTNLKVENYELKKQLAASIQRDPKTGRLITRKKAN